MAEVESSGYATRRASGRLQTKARAQPCPICGIVLAGDELLRHAETCRAYDSDNYSEAVYPSEAEDSSSDESFAEPITIWTERSPDPKTPLVMTFINKPRPKAVRNRPPPKNGTPWPSSRPLDPYADVTQLPRTSYSMRVESRRVHGKALVSAKAADERVPKIPESNLIYTLRNGEPDLGKTREWQRFVAEEARLLASFGGVRGSSTKRPAPPLGSKKKKRRASSDILRRLASLGPRQGPSRLKRLARAAYAAEVPIPPRGGNPAKDYVRRMQQVHKLASGTIEAFAALLKTWRSAWQSRVSHHGDDAASMAWKLHAVEPTRPRHGGHGDNVASTRRYQSKRQHPRTRDAQVLAIYNLLKGFPDLVKDFYQFLPAEDRPGAREVVAAEVARLDAIGKPTVAAPPCVPTLPYSEALTGASVGWRLDTNATASPGYLAGRVQGAPSRPGFRLPPPPSMTPVEPPKVVAPPENADVRQALDALRSHLARFCRGVHSVDPRDRGIAEDVGALERVAARFGVSAAPDAFHKVADVVARCAVRVGTNGSDGDLEGLARALRALAFDAKTARVYDAVLHVLPDAAKVLGAVAKL